MNCQHLFQKKYDFFALYDAKKVIKTVDKRKSLCYNSQAFEKECVFGGIAQLARAFGSYPEGRGFKSNFRYQPLAIVGGFRPGGQAAKTPPFHGGNTSSILVRVTTNKKHLHARGFLFYSNYSSSMIFSMIFAYFGSNCVPMPPMSSSLTTSFFSGSR